MHGEPVCTHFCMEPKDKAKKGLDITYTGIRCKVDSMTRNDKNKTPLMESQTLQQQRRRVR